MKKAWLRKLGLETLENRTLLSATTWDAAFEADAAVAAEMASTLSAATIDLSTIVVDTNSDVTADDGLTTLREAIAQASAGDTITFADDVANIVLSGEQLTVDKAITIDGGGDVTIDANGQSRVFYVPSSATGDGEVVSFVGLTVTGGKVKYSMDGESESSGGGFLLAGSAVIEDCVVKNNSSSYGGGGVAAWGNYGAGTSVSVVGTLIVENAVEGAMEGYGGGIYARNVDLSVNYTTLAYNAAQDAGGGIYNENPWTTIEVANSIVVENTGGDLSVGCATNGDNVLSGYTAWDNAGEDGVENLKYDASLPLFKDPANGDYTLAEGSQAFALNGGNIGFTGSDVVNENEALVVTTENDLVDATDGVLSLREAIAQASAGDSITFADNVSTIVLRGEQLTVDKAITIDGGGDVTIDANQQSRVFYVPRSATTDGGEVAFIGLTVTGGKTELTMEAHPVRPNIYWAAPNDATDSGAGFNIAGNASITNCVVTGNYAAYNGGGVFSAGLLSNGVATGNSVKIVDTVIADNAAGYDGGGIFGIAGSEIDLEFVTIANNAAAGTTNSSGGAGIYLASSDVKVNIVDSIVVENVFGADVSLAAPSAPGDSGSGSGNADIDGGGSVSGDYVLTTFTAWANAPTTIYAYDASQPLFTNAASGDYSLVAGSQASGKASDGGDLGAIRGSAVVAPDAPALSVECVDWQTLGVTIDCVEGVTDYVLQFATDENFENVVRELTTTSETDVWPEDRYRNIYNFTENTTYFVRAKSVGTNGADDSDWSNVATATTAKIELATPTLTVGPKTADSLAVNVGYVSFARSYVLEYSTSEDFANATTLSFSYSGAKTIDGLEEGTTYYVRVKATGNSEGRVDSDWISGSATTYSTEIELAQPTLTASVRSTTALTAKIGYVSYAEEYAIEYSTDPTFPADATETIVRPYNGSAKIDNLLPGTTYYLRAKGTNATYGDSPYSETVVATTAALPTVAAPTLTADPRALCALTANVGYVSYAESYVVEYSTDPTFPADATETIVRPYNGPTKIGSLPSGETFYVRAKATNATYGDSEWSATAVVETTELAVPTLAAQTRSTSALTLNFGYVSAAANYVVEYATTADFADAQTFTYDSNGSVKLGDLAADATYFVRAYAVDAFGGVSEYSEVVSATTANLAVPTLELAPRSTNALTATLGYVSGAAIYEVEYATTADFADAQKLERSYNGPAKLADLTVGTTYFVRARVVDSFGVASDWSETVSETVGAPASSALLISDAFAELALEDGEWDFFA